RGGLSIVSLADPANPVEHTYINANFSTWKDIKTYGSRAYVITEGGGGILIVDLSDLPNTPTHHFHGNTRAHNLWIDESEGCLFLSGASGTGAPVLYGLTANPDTPTLVGFATPAFYSHDVYVRNDTLWSANISDGFFTVFDVSNKAAPQLLATQNTSRNFCHNLWLSDDSKTLFTTDEKPGAWIDAYDVSDLSDIKRIDRWRTPNPAVVPHNVHVHNDYLVISYYDDGLVILDGSRPSNLIEVARYDTYPLAPNTLYDGAWGAYPFLPSGNILVSDRQTGLHVLSPNYIRACWLEGLVTDSITGAALYNVDINLSGNATPPNSDIFGAYKTGTALAGTYQVTFSKLGYISKTITTTLQNGQLTIENIQLALAPVFIFDLHAEDHQSGNSIANSIVKIIGKTIDTTYTGVTDANGHFQQALLDADYELWIGHWGHQTQKDSFSINSNTSTTILLNKGYKDEFALDLGWSISGSVTRGDWIRLELYDIPGLFFPFLDADANDLGDKCMTTGIYPLDSLPTGIVWIDSGATTMTSPLMDLSTATDPYLNFKYYFYSLAPASGALEVYISNGIDTVQAMSFSNAPNGANWNPSPDIYLKNHVPLTNTMQVWFRASNYNSSMGSLIRVWVDDFSVLDSSGAHIAVQQISTPKTIATASPNPFQETISIDYAQVLLPAALEVVNALGQIVEQRTLEYSEGNLQLGQNWDTGIYFIKISDQTLKVIKN
ncbi:MAG: choice-of-anchor B family protein, partial [Aureispira sp.]|nr:choice-of-anchor B family protein [Aureispira sp.]